MCDKFDTRDADALLGGPAVPLSVGSLGCSYSVRGKGVRLTLTLSDEGPGARKTYDTLKQKTKSGGWLAGEEMGMGTAAFGELIKRTPQNPISKSGFVILKGTKLIQIYVSDSLGTSDLAGRKDTLDRLRPIARKAVDRIP
jgi:hypothetical protein